MSKIKRNLLLSYPRSGNTWLRYCVEVLTNKPTFAGINREAGIFDKAPVLSLIGKMDKNANDYILIKRHHFKPENESFDVDKVVFIIRNYKECIIRHAELEINPNINTLKSEISGQIDTVDYLGLIKAFDKFNGKKLLLYYEDLIINPKKTLEDLLIFLEIENFENKLNKFIYNLENHKNNSIKIYSLQGESHTKGQHLSFHINKLNSEQRILWDKTIREKSEKLYEKYLKRYEE